MSFGVEPGVSPIVLVSFLLPTTDLAMACEIIPVKKHQEVFMGSLMGKFFFTIKKRHRKR